MSLLSRIIILILNSLILYYTPRDPCKDQQFVPPFHSFELPSLPPLYQAKLPPGANPILFVKNLDYQITGDDLYDLFGRYGSIQQLRIGNETNTKTKGTAFVVFSDVMDVRLAIHYPYPFISLIPLF